jgi:AraC-like DNA-binding protein
MQRHDPVARRAELLGTAARIVRSGGSITAARIATEAGCSPALVKHYLYPATALRRRLVLEAVRLRDAKLLAPMLTWAESIEAPPALRRAASRELAK